MKKGESIIIVNKKELENKIKIFVKEGLEKLHVVADFDKTITKITNLKGEKVPSIISWLRRGGYLNNNYPARSEELFAKYHPMEISQTLSDEEKREAMREWWSTHFKLLAECGLDSFTLNKAVEEMNEKGELILRDGAKELFHQLSSKKIPLLIMSASITEMIKEYLKLNNLSFDNIHIVANKLDFDKKGKFVGVEEPIIHSMNKKEIEIKPFPFYEKLSTRNNIILLGDSLEDIGMVDDFEYKNIIKIGFLNDTQVTSDKIKQLEEYKKAFDIIITDDGSLEYVNELVEKITK